MKLSGLTKMVKRQLVCNVFHNDESDDFYIGTASAIYCATGFPRPLNRNQMGAMLGISEDTMIEKVVYNDFDCAYKSDFQGFNLDDTIKDEVEVKKLGIGIYCGGEILIPLVTEDQHMVGIICQSHLAPLEDEIKNNGFIRYYQRKQIDGTIYYIVKNGMRVRAAVMAYTVPLWHIRCRTTQKQSCKNWLQCWQKLTSANRKNRNRRLMIWTPERIPNSRNNRKGKQL